MNRAATPLAVFPFLQRALLPVLCLGLVLGLPGCASDAKPSAGSQPTSIFNPQTTVLPAVIPPAPTMKISLPGGAPVGQETAVPAIPTPVRPTNLNPPNQPISINDLALPFDPDEIAAILKANPSIHFRYKHRAFVFPNCSTLTHLGEIMELYSDFSEGNPFAPSAPAFKVYAPTDMRILKVWGTQRYRLVINSRIGTNSNNQALYLSLLSVTRLEASLAKRLAGLAGVAPEKLNLDPGNPLSAVGPFLFSLEYRTDADDVRVSDAQAISTENSILVHQGDIIGYKEGPWEWYPTCDTEHTLSLHAFLTTNDANDHTQSVETYVPEITRYYLNLVVRELVIKRGLSIDVQYRSRNIGHEPEFLAEELFDSDVRAQVSLSPWLNDIHPQRFTVTPASIPPMIINPDE